MPLFDPSRAGRSIVTFIVFAVYRYRTGVLSVSAVFYVLSLLQLPKSTMGGFLFALQVRVGAAPHRDRAQAHATRHRVRRCVA